MKYLYLLLLCALVAGCTTYSTRVFKPMTYSSTETFEWRVRKVVKEQAYMDSLAAVISDIAWPLRKNALRFLPSNRHKKEARLQFGYHYTAVDLWDASKMHKHDKKAVKILYGLDVSNTLEKQPIYLKSTVVGSPIYRAGVRGGDKILRIAGIPIYGSKQHRRLFETNNNFSQGTLFSIERKLNDALLDTFDVFVKPDSTVNYHVVVFHNQEQTAFAYAKERYVGITTGMLGALNPKEVPYVLGHELAHLLLKHSEKSMKNAKAASNRAEIASGIIDLLGVLITKRYDGPSYTNADRQRDREYGYFLYHKEFEREADYLGIYLTAMSGYEIDGVEDFWRRMHEASGSPYSKTHPTDAQRFHDIRQYVQEIEFKRDTGRPVLPDQVSPH